MIHSCLASVALLPSERILFVIRYLQTHELEYSHPVHWSMSILYVIECSLYISDGGNQELETYRHGNMKAVSAYLCLRKYIFP